VASGPEKFLCCQRRAAVGLPHGRRHEHPAGADDAPGPAGPGGTPCGGRQHLALPGLRLLHGPLPLRGERAGAGGAAAPEGHAGAPGRPAGELPGRPAAGQGHPGPGPAGRQGAAVP
jgi:hypothetical protein